MDSPDYNYQNCMIGKILDLIKCQPYWVNISQSHKNCTEVKDLRTFLDTFTFLSHGTANQINDRFGCLKPCTFIEYQVFSYMGNEESSVHWDFSDCRTTNLFRKTIHQGWWKSSSVYNIFNVNNICRRGSRCIPLDLFCCWLWGSSWTFCWCQFSGIFWILYSTFS